MSKFIVTITEHINKDFTIEATDMEEAMEIAEKRYKNGEIILDGDSEVHTKLMMCCDPSDDSCTEWTEF